LTGKPVKAVKIADQVASQLQEWFQSGRLTPGTRLPPERELAAQFGVSRTSVRDALRRLELAGYLDARQGTGRTCGTRAGRRCRSRSAVW